MKLKTKIILSYFLILIPFLIIGIFSFWGLTTIKTDIKDKIAQNVKVLDTATRLNSLTQFIRYYDEVLTQSARNYAFTGNEYWYNRYEEIAPLLDKNIKEAIKLGDKEDEQLFSSIDESNLALVKMEEESMNLVKNGQRTSAINILEGKEYARQKKIYQNALVNYFKKQGKAYDDILAESTKTIDNSIIKVEESVNRGAIETIISFIFASVFSIILGLLTSYKIIKPIQKLNKTAKEITLGNLDARVEIDSKDEIGQMARAFNSMTDKLQETQRHIEDRVKEQTEEINKKNQDLEQQQKAILNMLKNVEEEKQKAIIEKTKYQSLLTSIGDGIIVTDEATKVILMNKAAENILGWKQTEIEGKKLAETVAVVDEKGQELKEDLRPITIAAATLKPFIASINTNYYYLTKNKEKIPVALSASPVLINNKLIGVIDVFRDVSKEKNIDRMKTEFISLASHQLRTPLSAMKWYLEMLLNGDAGKLTSEQENFIKNIEESNERMISLVNSLLNISRIESGRIIIDPKPTLVNELIESVIRELKSNFEEKKINLIMSVHEALPKINIDPKLIRNVYLNLISNAIKYMPAGGEISIFVSKVNDEIITQVTDNGYGIPKAEQNKIFNKFYRATNIVKFETEGTGLGLYLVKAVADSSGAKIWFESEEGKGTSFWFSLPMTGSVARKGEVTLDS